MTKKCVCCRTPFSPAPTVNDRQKSCASPRCRKEVKAQAQAKWLAANPDYFRGRYPKVKEWLENNSDYPARYLAAHPEYRERKREKERARRLRIKQNETIRKKIDAIRRLQGADTQETLRLKLDALLDFLALEGTWSGKTPAPARPASNGVKSVEDLELPLFEAAGG